MEYTTKRAQNVMVNTHTALVLTVVWHSQENKWNIQYNRSQKHKVGTHTICHTFEQVMKRTFVKAKTICAHLSFDWFQTFSTKELFHNKKKSTHSRFTNCDIQNSAQPINQLL